MTKRSLGLCRETIRSLDAPTLGGIAAGAPPETQFGCPGTQLCLSPRICTDLCFSQGLLSCTIQ
jgi:hypothetical protein